MAGMSSVRSRTVKPVKPAVCVESTAEGRIQVSSPAAERIGSATVSEHWPTQEMSWMVRIFGYVMSFLSFFSYPFTAGSMISPCPPQ